jgi:hypothetical protein
MNVRGPNNASRAAIGMGILGVACAASRATVGPKTEAGMKGAPIMTQASDPAPRKAGPTVAVNFGRDIGWSGSREMEVQRDGMSTLVTTFSEDTSEIGWWQASVTRETFDALVQALHDSGYDRLPGAGTMVPDTKVITLGERFEGEPLPVIWTCVTPPPALGAVIGQLEGIEKRLRQHPLRVLRGAATFVAGGAREAALDVTLSNVGTETLRLFNPLTDARHAALERGDIGYLRLVFERQGVSDVQVDLTAADLFAPPDAPRTELCELRPGERLRFSARKKVDIKHGNYLARVVYAAPDSREGDPAFVGGVLSMRAGAF